MAILIAIFTNLELYFVSAPLIREIQFLCDAILLRCLRLRRSHYIYFTTSH